MTVPVRYACPRCRAVVRLQRAPTMADKSVTPYPLDGWEYADPEDDVEAADGVRFVCGSFLGFEDAGCGEPFYVNFVRFEDGRKVEPPREQEHVEINVGTGPRWPSGPSGPAGPG